MIYLDWPTFKSFVDAWKIHGLIRYTPKSGGQYSNVWVNFEGQLIQVGSGGITVPTDVTDFETNYEPSSLTTWIAGKDVNRNDVAGQFTVGPSGNTTYDFKLLTNSWLWGGDLIVQGNLSVDGDQCQVQVVDKDGLFYPAGTVLRTLITKKFLPSQRNISVASPDSKALFVYGGLYFRFVYTEVSGLIGKVAAVNLIAMS